MLKLNLPGFAPKIILRDEKHMIFDPLRRKYVSLSPEEWVRQHFINYLLTEKKYPEGLLANEVQIKLNATTKRCDTIVYDSFLSPLMIIEYKAPSVPITKNVFDQIVRYNMVLRVRYLIVSNGINHYCCKVDYEKQEIIYMETIPEYKQL